jgi:predicted GH43/DUF377 family glycosyl hydrolase
VWSNRIKIFEASGQHGWMKSHAQVPTVWVKDNVTLRIFFATRPEPGLSVTTFIDVDANDPRRIIYVHDKPILPLGKPGTFDEHGVMPSSVVEWEGKLLLYYSGWSRSVGVPYTNLTGVAISEDGETFKKLFEGPILTKTPLEPYSATSPFVMRIAGRWRMWYCSGVGWQEVDGKLEHQYDIKSASSIDGLIWAQSADCALPCLEDEALTRPTVLESDGSFHMWFCYRHLRDFRDGQGSYRIGYAQSPDSINWQRADPDGGLTLGDSGWDSSMVAYPHVIKLGNRILMFYNGNGFGQAGLGFAEYQGSLAAEISA